jgi:hypothetical protein
MKGEKESTWLLAALTSFAMHVTPVSIILSRPHPH